MSEVFPFTCLKSTKSSVDDESLDDSITDPDYTQASDDSSADSASTDDESLADSSSTTSVSEGGRVSHSDGIEVICMSKSQYFDKKPYCYYCSEPQTQIQRHWMSKHRNEAEVIRLASLRDKRERNMCITKLRNMGNHVHNSAVLQAGKGQFLVTYRPKPGATADDYRPCESCWCYLRKNDLFRHRCQFPKSQKKRVAADAYLLLPVPAGTSEKVHQLLSGMRDGNIKLMAKTDPLIMEYASKFITKKGFQKKVYIRDKVRELARFLLAVRKQDGMTNKTLDDCISTSSFKVCVTAVNELAEFDDSTATYGKPTLAIKLGQALSKVATIVKRNAIIARNDDRIREAELFGDLCSTEWSESIAHRALNTLRERKRNKINMMPLSSDVHRLNKFLIDSCNAGMNTLNKLPSSESTLVDIEHEWRSLAEATLAHVIIFNRRRQGEVSKMTLEDYQSKQTVDNKSDSMDALSPMERNLCNMFHRVELTGKRDRIVPVLFLPWHLKMIDTLMTYRPQAGVLSTNNFVFAYSHSDHCLRGCDALRNAAVKCGASNPEALRATNLRKHVATLCQVLNLKDHELDMLANYMGHDVRVHRQYYRLPDDVMQTSKLAKVFLLMDSGNLAKQKGKSLDDIAELVDGDEECVGE